MINQIIIKSRKQIEDYLSYHKKPVENNWALISIWNTKELVHVFTRKTLNLLDCQKALSIQFVDLTLDEYIKLKNKREYKLFDASNAKQIIDFVNHINSLDIPSLVIHCAAGISRSSAVGLFVCRYLNMDEDKYRKDNTHILPNFYILNILNEASGLNSDYVKFWTTKENLQKREIMFNQSYGKELCS